MITFRTLGDEQLPLESDEAYSSTVDFYMYTCGTILV